jgi:hypothetical protein
MYFNGECLLQALEYFINIYNLVVYIYITLLSNLQRGLKHCIVNTKLANVFKSQPRKSYGLSIIKLTASTNLC